MNKKSLYESIMKNVAREVKKALNEGYYCWEDALEHYLSKNITDGTRDALYAIDGLWHHYDGFNYMYKNEMDAQDWQDFCEAKDTIIKDNKNIWKGINSYFDLNSHFENIESDDFEDDDSEEWEELLNSYLYGELPVDDLVREGLETLNSLRNKYKGLDNMYKGTMNPEDWDAFCEAREAILDTDDAVWEDFDSAFDLESHFEE